MTNSYRQGIIIALATKRRKSWVKKRALLRNLKQGSKSGKEGFLLEAEIVKALLENGIPITEAGVKYDVKSLGGRIGEIDIATSDYIVECFDAVSGSSKSAEDFLKYFSGNPRQPYINPDFKEVIVYALNGIKAANAQEISSLGVIVVTSLEELINILKGVK